MGDGPERLGLERLAEEISGPHDVGFHGWMHRNSPQWRTLYESGELSTSLGAFENSPIAALEALAAGHALVASDITACRPLSGSAGIPVGADPMSIAAGLERLLSRTSDELLVDTLQCRPCR